jgi:hypothetical protein
MTGDDVAAANVMLRAAFGVDADFAGRLARYRAMAPESRSTRNRTRYGTAPHDS